MTATGYIGGDPTKVDIDGWTLGDVLAANAAGALEAVPIGTPAEVLTVDAAEPTDLGYAAGGGGGAVASVFGRTGAVVAAAGDYVTADITGLIAALAGKATIPVVRQEYVTTGDVVLPNTGGVFAALSGFELAIPAAVGDYVSLSVNALRTNTAAGFLDAAVWVGAPGAAVRYLSNGTATPAIEGTPGWYPAGGFAIYSGDRGFTVTPGDLDGGNVRFRIAVKAAGAGTLFASANYPFYWRAVNIGPVT